MDDDLEQDDSEDGPILDPWLQALITTTILAEREACAKACEEEGAKGMGCDRFHYTWCAANIRKRPLHIPPIDAREVLKPSRRSDLAGFAREKDLQQDGYGYTFQVVSEEPMSGHETWIALYRKQHSE